MKFVTKVVDLSTHKSECLILPIFPNGKLSATGEHVNKACKGQLKKLINRGDTPKKAQQTLLLPELNHPTIKRALLIGCDEEPISVLAFQKLIQTVITQLQTSNITDATLCLTELAIENKDTHWKARQLVEKILNGLYQFNECKSSKKPDFAIKTLTLAVNADDEKAAKKAVNEAKAIADGMKISRDLANLPGNICTPDYLLKEASKLAAQFSAITTSSLDEKAMKKLGMGAFLAVSAGSSQPGRLIVINYQGGKKTDSPYVLVGKGVTFDTGGISLKPAPEMDQMKYDMSGSASVIGTLFAAATLKLNINIVGILACAENMPSGAATKPGDIVTTMSGKTVEILNTDAEGRLVLCDSLTYAERFKPKTVIDIATLPGACVIALGNTPSGVMGNNPELVDQIKEAADTSHDRVWELPIWDDYQELLDSNFADIANIGGRAGGTITAACFLSRFTQNYPWAHLDIAGTAWITGSQKGSTGRPVPLLTQYLINQAD